MPEFSPVFRNERIRSELRTLAPLAVLGMLCCSLWTQAVGAVEETQPWADWTPEAEASTGEASKGLDAGLALPAHHRGLRLDLAALQATVANAPMENDAIDAAADLQQLAVKADQGLVPVVVLPLPDGSMARFRVERARVMADSLMERFPGIRAFRGIGLDHPSAEARFELDPQGVFHGMISGLEGGPYFINPATEWQGFEKASAETYMSFARRHVTPRDDLPKLRCRHGDFEGSALSTQPGLDVWRELRAASQSSKGLGDKMSTGGVLRTYRTAIAATGEYTRFHGGTVAGGMAAINTAVNRMNAVLRRELSLRLALVGNNDALIFTNPATDPFSNFDVFAMLEENQELVDDVVGNGSYDLGHVFGSSGGGVAILGGSCIQGVKAFGVSSLPRPVGDPFVVDYVGHELGHQFGANHIFNASTGFCGPNRAPSAAYEPGSGSTIMSYSGICGAENLQTFSDDIYNSHSFDEMVAHVHQNVRCGNSGGGAGVPSVEAGPRYTIPAKTPFELRGSGNAASYAWEQHDLGAPGPPNTDNGNRPIFRAFQPTASANRTLPRLNHLLDGVQRLGESLPTTSRDLTFRLTGRNNQGGVAHDEVVLRVAGGIGPFEVLQPNSETAWTAGETVAVEWDVAETDREPVACSAVDILFSTDGGNSFPTLLAEAVPNVGTQDITVPAEVTSKGRVKVACSDNLFFAISSGGDFEVRGESSCVADEATLCLDEGRFLVTVEWRDFVDLSDVGRLVAGGVSEDSGLFYFFDPNNWEMLVKVINGCSFNDHFWVFAAATTNVEYNLRVVDTQTGVEYMSENPLGNPSEALTDTQAFATCP